MINLKENNNNDKNGGANVKTWDELLDESKVTREEQVLTLEDLGLFADQKIAAAQEPVETPENKAALEEVTNALLDKGMIYEPVLGRMKRI